MYTYWKAAKCWRLPCRRGRPQDGRREHGGVCGSAAGGAAALGGGHGRRRRARHWPPQWRGQEVTQFLLSYIGHAKKFGICWCLQLRPDTASPMQVANWCLSSERPDNVGCGDVFVSECSLLQVHDEPGTGHGGAQRAAGAAASGALHFNTLVQFSASLHHIAPPGRMVAARLSLHLLLAMSIAQQ